MHTDRCRDCGHEIDQRWTPAGKLIDLEPDWRRVRPDANVAIVELEAAAGAVGGDLTFAVVLSGGALTDARASEIPLRIPHAAVCARRRRR